MFGGGGSYSKWHLFVAALSFSGTKLAKIHFPALHLERASANTSDFRTQFGREVTSHTFVQLSFHLPLGKSCKNHFPPFQVYFRDIDVRRRRGRRGGPCNYCTYSAGYSALLPRPALQEGEGEEEKILQVWEGSRKSVCLHSLPSFNYYACVQRCNSRKKAQAYCHGNDMRTPKSARKKLLRCTLRKLFLLFFCANSTMQTPTVVQYTPAHIMLHHSPPSFVPYMKRSLSLSFLAAHNNDDSGDGR